MVDDWSSSESFYSAVSEDETAACAPQELLQQVVVREEPHAPTLSVISLLSTDSNLFDVCHRACFEGDVHTLQDALSSGACSIAELSEQVDSHGLTLLHVAAMRDNAGCVGALLDAGCNVKTKSSAGWLPYQEAASYRCKKSLVLILSEHRRLFETSTREKLKKLQVVLKDMPDCTFQVAWELGSPILGAVLHKHLPRDTYTLYKWGTRVRIDGHLKGMKEDTKTLLPNWKYGHFSILINTSADDRMALFVNHEKQQFTAMEVLGKVSDLGPESKEGSLEASMVLEQSDVKRARLKFSNFKFCPIKGWLTSQIRENVNGMATTLYEAHGELMAVTTKKSKLRELNKRTSYAEYLAMPAARDVEATVPLNLSTAITGNSEDKVAQAFADRSKASKAEASTSTSTRHSSAAPDAKEAAPSRFSFSSMVFSSKGNKGASTQAPDRSVRPPIQEGSEGAGGSDPVRVQVAGTGRTVRARMWLTQDSPINQKQLLPLLDIVGSTNQYIIKICNFMEKYGSLHLFPVRVQVPLIMSLRATLHVKNIQLWGDQPSTSKPAGQTTNASNGSGKVDSPPEIEFWEPPAHYKHVSIDQLDAAHLAKRAAAKRAAREKKEAARREKRRPVNGADSSRHSGTSSGVAESAPI